MSRSYDYIDQQFVYIDPITGVLRNLYGISDPEVLLFVESGAVTKRLQELYISPIRVEGIITLFRIHKYLFQDIYSWAGEERIVEINKDGKQFFLRSQFSSAYQFIDQIIDQYKTIDPAEINQLATKLAEILDCINYLHPFRDGNGRAQREFLRLLALEKGLILNLNPPDNKLVYEHYMRGTIEGDVYVLTRLIYELISQDSYRD